MLAYFSKKPESGGILALIEVKHEGAKLDDFTLNCVSGCIRMSSEKQ